jgi:hypothetical protein
MHKLGLVAAVGLCCLGITNPAQAGLYCAEEPPQTQESKTPPKGAHADPRTLFIPYLQKLRQLANSQMETPQLKEFVEFTDSHDPAKAKTDQAKQVILRQQELLQKKLKDADKINLENYRLRRKYLERKEALAKKRRSGRLTVEEGINLSYYLVRLGQSVEALDVLRRLEGTGKPIFFVYSNLATVNLLEAAGARPGEARLNLGTAQFYLKKALRQWPKKEWPGGTEEQSAWYKQADKLLLKLIALRLKESNQSPPINAGNPSPPFSNVDDLFGVKFIGEKGVYEAGTLAAAQKAKLKKLNGNEVALVQQLLTWLPRDDRLYWLLGELLNAKPDTETAFGILDECVKSRGLTNIPLLREHRKTLMEARAKSLPVAAPAPKEETSWSLEPWQILVGTAGLLVIGLFIFFQIKEILRRGLRNTTLPKD